MVQNKHDIYFTLVVDDFAVKYKKSEHAQHLMNTLKELFEVPPDVLKFDVKFVHGLPFTTPQHRATIQSLIRIVKDLNVVPLAEGVETVDEASVCFELGFELAQGYLFGRAESAAHWINS